MIEKEVSGAMEELSIVGVFSNLRQDDYLLDMVSPHNGITYRFNDVIGVSIVIVTQHGSLFVESNRELEVVKQRENYG